MAELVAAGVVVAVDASTDVDRVEGSVQEVAGLGVSIVVGREAQVRFHAAWQTLMRRRLYHIAPA